jgi:hypothetical protein
VSACLVITENREHLSVVAGELCALWIRQVASWDRVQMLSGILM